jgi:hypothetical protein
MVTTGRRPANTDGVNYEHFTMTATATDVDYETGYEYQVFRLNDTLNDGHGTTHVVKINDVNSPLGWETYAGWNLPGNNANNNKARTITGTGNSTTAASSNFVFQLGLGNEFCFRIRATSARGKSCWSYYPTVVKGL